MSENKCCCELEPEKIEKLKQIIAENKDIEGALIPILPNLLVWVWRSPKQPLILVSSAIEADTGSDGLSIIVPLLSSGRFCLSAAMIGSMVLFIFPNVLGRALNAPMNGVTFLAIS